MPDTRPGIQFNDKGICHACLVEQKKDQTDWDKRWKELQSLCDKYRDPKGSSYDCIIAVSGGKDSHTQVHVFKELLNMNPLLVTVEDNFTLTEAGKHNLRNISEAFGCDIISIKPNIKIQKAITRYTFEKYAKPTWYIDRLIYTYPIHMALKFNIPLVIYGENISYEYGGHQQDESPSAKNQIENDVAGDFVTELINEGFLEKELVLCKYPSEEEINKSNLNPIYLSYYYRWNDYKNYITAKRHGFKDLENEWDRGHFIEFYQQVDSMAYLVHPWLKYPKFGHACATDVASRFIRLEMITRDEAIKLVKERDHNLDRKAIDDFCSFAGYTVKEFWDVVDRFYNKELFKKDKFDQWVLKDPIWKK